jgi:hypothetical protein
MQLQLLYSLSEYLLAEASVTELKNTVSVVHFTTPFSTAPKASKPTTDSYFRRYKHMQEWNSSIK